MKKLKDPEAGLMKFFTAIDVLGEKLGPILFQLPPHWQIDLDRLADFLRVLPRHHRYAFEFRNETWNTKPVYELLSKSNAGYCIYDLAGYQSPIEVTADLVYVRLHGPGGKYQGSYTDAALNEWATRIIEWRRQNRKIYVYFDNDQAGFAAHNAVRLRDLLTASQGAL
jgi:uncharacterized protein YecE (DUF72 family)